MLWWTARVGVCTFACVDLPEGTRRPSGNMQITPKIVSVSGSFLVEPGKVDGSDGFVELIRS